MKELNFSTRQSNSTVPFFQDTTFWLFRVLEYCDVKTRNNAIFICKHYSTVLTSNSSFRWRLERLHIEHGIYCTVAMYHDNKGPSPPPNFKELYLSLSNQEKFWLNECNQSDGERGDDTTSETLNINVSVRFKPLQNSNKNMNCIPKVTLPLHQRLKLIRHKHKLRSNRDALNILKKEGQWFHDKWLTVEKENINNANIEELNDKIETKKYAELSCGIRSIDCKKNNVVIVDATRGLRNFEFDKVLHDGCKQSVVYGISAQPLVQDFINGVNACCLVYGVTGSGKTYTMFGPKSTSSKSNGIVQMACEEIFDVLEYREKHLSLDIEAKVSISYVEIYGNDISDLLSNGRTRCSNKAASQGFILRGGAFDYYVQNVKDVLGALKKGEKQKREAATALNDRSSRAHSLVIFTLCQQCKETNISRTSKLFLVDLGGCEQTKKSEIVSGCMTKIGQPISTNSVNPINKIPVGESQYSTGFVKSDRMREAVYINLGLMALKSCVEALASKSQYVPYSNSKLTMMLSSALGGNSKTSVIICAAQEAYQAKETIAALKFGQSCRMVQNWLNTETDFLQKMIDDLDSQIRSCLKEIQQKERWEVREEQRLDTLAEDGTIEYQGFGGVEVRKTTVLVGAEKEHILLHDLLRQKAELTGVSNDYCGDDLKYGGEIGFGDAHSLGLGRKFNQHDVSEYRFGKPMKEKVPLAVHTNGKSSETWKSGDESLNNVEESRLKQMKKKSNLVYSGLSA